MGQIPSERHKALNRSLNAFLWRSPLKVQLTAHTVNQHAHIAGWRAKQRVKGVPRLRA
jgi:hypothetical protein